MYYWYFNGSIVFVRYDTKCKHAHVPIPLKGVTIAIILKVNLCVTYLLMTYEILPYLL